MKLCIFCGGSRNCLDSIKPLRFLRCEWCCARGTTENPFVAEHIPTTLAMMKALNKAQHHSKSKNGNKEGGAPP